MRARKSWVAAAALLAGAALWAWAAHALWQTTVPSSLELPQIDAGDFFGADFLRRSASYERFLAILGLLSWIALVAVLALYARRGHMLMRESAAGRIGTGTMLGMLGFALVWLVETPFGLAALWWQRRHDVAEQDYFSWLVESFFGLGGEFVFLTAGLAIMMALAGALRHWWWLAAAPAFAALGLLFVFISPYLVPDTEPLRDQRLLGDVRAIELAEGLDDVRLRVQDVDRFTDAPNAQAAGFGPSRTVVLWNTLLDEDFSRPELRSVLAHELAHLARDHPLKGIGWTALFLIPALALTALLTRPQGGLARPEAVPVALLVLVLLSLLATPLFNAVSRRAEAEADWAALNATRDPAAQRSLLRRLAVDSLTSPDPPAWTVPLYGTHPSIVDRIAMADAWKRLAKRGDVER